VNAVHCPSCALAAQPQTWDDVSAFKCAACHGNFVSGSALAAFLAEHSGVRTHARLLEKAQAAPLTARPLTCPHCKTRSYHAVQMGVVEIDVCNTCGGVFLDQDEALLYFRQVREQITPNKVIDGTVEALDGANVVLQLGNFILKLIH
jgi:Zn-finger nucleic acid-binding protein